jgi:predicted  nucleic acid-binding Zn-ribbon protein
VKYNKEKKGRQKKKCLDDLFSSNPYYNACLDKIRQKVKSMCLLISTESQYMSGELQPNIPELQPHIQELQPHIQELQPHIQELQPHILELQPHILELQPHVRGAMKIKLISNQLKLE